jgi:hypothetical protein
VATGGQSIPEDAVALAEAAAAGTVYRTGLASSRSLQPIWYWLLLLTGLLLFFDVGVRRVAVDPSEAVGAARRTWERLRGRAAPASDTPQFLDRLKSRKAQVGESLEKAKATRRFEAAEGVAPAEPVPGANQPAAPTPRTAPKPAPKLAADPEAAPADYASRLLKAKKKVWEERDKDKDKGQ